MHLRDLSARVPLWQHLGQSHSRDPDQIVRMYMWLTVSRVCGATVAGDQAISALAQALHSNTYLQTLE